MSTYIQYPPYTFLKNESEKSVFTGGVEVELLNELKQFFNFQYDIVDCNKVWGNQVSGKFSAVNSAQ